MGRGGASGSSGVYQGQVEGWGGAVGREGEAGALVRARAALKGRVMARLRELHPYEVPAMLVLPIEGGNADYLEWARAQTVG